MQHINQGTPFIVMSASRHDNSPRVNRALNSELRRRMQDQGVGGIVIEGHWTEHTEDGEEIDIIEETMFFPLTEYSELDIDGFKDFGEALIKTYKQDAFIFGDGDKIDLMWNDGNVETLGDSVSFTTATLQGAYSSIKGRNFVFEGF